MKNNGVIYRTLGILIVIGTIIANRFILKEGENIPIWLVIPLFVIAFALISIGVAISMRNKKSTHN